MMQEQKGRLRLGIDIGGTNSAFGLVDDNGTIIAGGRVPTCGHESVEAFVAAIRAAVESVMPGVSGRLSGIGVGAPCSNRTTGCIDGAVDLPWTGCVPLGHLLEREFGVCVSMTNDANAAAAGEMAFGSMKGVRDFIMITLGTGVGGGIVCDGHLLSGSRGYAAELGHVTLGEGFDRPCGCGRKGCLETYCSGRGVAATARQLLADGSRESLLREIDPDKLEARDVSEAARKGDRLAREVYEFTGTVLGRACANFLAVSDPEAVVLFGGVAKAGDLLVEPMQRAMDEAALHLYRGRVKVVVSSLPDAEAAILGAAALV